MVGVGVAAMTLAAGCGSSGDSARGSAATSTTAVSGTATTPTVAQAATVDESTSKPATQPPGDTTTPSSTTAAIADPVGALRNAKIVDPQRKMTVQLVNGMGQTRDDSTSPDFVAAGLRNETTGSVWPAIGIVYFNYGGSGSGAPSVVAMDSTGSVRVSEAFGDRNQVSRVAEVNGIVEVDYLEFGPGDALYTGGTIPAKLTFDPATGVLTKLPIQQPQRLDMAGMTTDGVKPLTFGDPATKAEALTGLQAKRSSTGGMCDPDHTSIATADGLTLVFADGQFYIFYTESSAWSTPSGGRVGMSVADLRRAIPSASPRVDYPTTYVVRSAGNTLSFSTDGSRVTKILGAQDDREC